MTTCAHPSISAGEPECPSRSGREGVHAFGVFAPFGAEWASVDGWDFGSRTSPERLYSLRFDVFSQMRLGGPHSPSVYPLRSLPAAPSRGLLRIRVQASRCDGRGCTDFFCDASGVDIYANHVHVEVWAPTGIGVAQADAEATQGASLGVLDEAVAPSVTTIGSSLRGTATLHTYAAAGESHPVPPRASRYAILTGALPDLQIAGTNVVSGAPASGPVGGVTAIQLAADSVVAWEVAP